MGARSEASPIQLTPEEGIAVAGLEDARERLGLLRALVGVAQDDVVAALVGFEARGLDGASDWCLKSPGWSGP